MTLQGAGRCQHRGTPNDGSDPKKRGVGFDIENKGGGLLQRQRRLHRPPPGLVGCPGDVIVLLARYSQGTGRVTRATRPPGCSRPPGFGVKKPDLE